MSEPHNHLEDFDSLPWASALLRSPAYSPGAGTLPRLPPPPNASNVPNLLWSSTLHGPTKLRAWQWLISNPSPSSPPTATFPQSATALAGYSGPFPETLLLVSLSTHLNGYRGLLHGGMFGVLVDQVGGICGRATIEEDFMTAEIRVRFKRAIPVPSVVLCKARATRVEGRKMWIAATLEDGTGGVYCEAETFWVVVGGKGTGGRKAAKI